MSEALEKQGQSQGLSAEAVDKLLQMDIGGLRMDQRNEYLWHFAVRQGLDPTTKPFNILKTREGGLIVFANKNCAEQIRKRDKITLEIVERGPLMIGDKAEVGVYVVKVRAKMTDELGHERFDESVGAVSIAGLVGEDLANAIMKCETKAKRRATYSIASLGLLDETEAMTIGTPVYPDQQSVRQVAPTPVAAPDLPTSVQVIDVTPQNQMPARPTKPPINVLPRAK